MEPVEAPSFSAIIMSSNGDSICLSVNTSNRRFRKFCFLMFHCMYLLECVIQQVQSSSKIPPVSTVFLRRKWLICHMSKASTQMLDSLHCLEKIHAYPQLHKSTADSVPLHSCLCLSDAWIPKQISVSSFLCVLVDTLRLAVRQLADGSYDGAPGGHV